MGPSILLSLLNPSFWGQLIKVANEVSELIKHPTVVGIAAAVADAAGAAAEVAPGSGVAGAVISAVEAAGAAVTKTYTSGSPQNSAQTVGVAMASAVAAAEQAVAPAPNNTGPLGGS